MFKFLQANQFIAHSSSDERPSQSLTEHLANVAQQAAKFAEDFGEADCARLIGLWHDLGKATPEFQDKLRKNPHRRVNHKGMGAWWAFERGIYDVAFAIAGHHSGMPDKTTLQSMCESKVEGAWAGMAYFQTLRERLLSHAYPELEPKTRPDYRALTPTDFDLRVRMLFSCLVDADRLDTEQYCQGPAARSEAKFPLISELIDRFFDEQERFSKKSLLAENGDSDLFRLRRRVFEEARQAGEKPQGIFSLTVPTGGAKTRAALGFAFEQARTHGMKRVIVVLPYTSILDQMAEVYADIFGEDAFLLHYTGWQSRDGKNEVEESPLEKKMQLAAENWDAPLILTTTVQLFDSIFSNKPGDCRKLHNLANSIIVLDEVQTLPLKYLEPICSVLSGLQKNYGATILLSTATQPALDRVKGFPKPQEIIAEPEKDFQILKRVKYETHIDEQWPWEKVSETLLESGGSGMVIVNTKQHALDLFDIVQKTNPDALHLSTYMCGAHRRDVIEQVRLRLKEKDKRCLLISTQLVEAGVDIDFPLVMRAVGPLDRVVQAAGRCNREGKLGVEGGRMIVFKPEDNKMPRGVYETAKGHFELFIASGRFHPDDPATFPAYFAGLFQDVDLDCVWIEEGGRRVKIRINEERKRFNFRTVGDNFHLIEDGGTRAVFVGYDGGANKWEGSPAQKLLMQLSDAVRDQRRIVYRRLQPYMVQVFNKRVSSLLSQGIITEDSKTEELMWEKGEYSAEVGIAAGRLEIENHFA